MKAIQSLLIVTLASGALIAQTPAKTPAPVKGKPVAEKAAAVEKKVTTPFAKKKDAKPGKAVPASAKEQQSASRVSATASSRSERRRDPFVSPIVRASGSTGPACSTGKRCLMVDQIQLKGIVKSPSGYIAVVENAAKRAYFLRENDPVFNGSVVRITGDTVVFRTSVMDKLGKQEMKEVVKKVNAPVV